LTVSGGDITLGGTGRIQGVDTVSAGTDAANKTYVDTAVAGIVDSAPSTLDTLNELAAALGDDANFATTTATNIGQKLGATASITLTGAITGSGSFSSNAVSITTSSGTGINAATLDSLDSTQFLRSDAADTKTSGDLSFSDSVKAIFGAGSDLQIYSDGANALINHSNTLAGALYLMGDNNVIISNQAGTENKAVFTTNGAVTLYYDNAAKLATTATGADITGTLTADGLTVDTNVVTQATAIELNGTSFADTERLSLDFSRGGSQGVRLSLEPDESQVNGDFIIETGGFGSTSDRLRIEANGDVSLYADDGTTQGFFWDASTQSLGLGTTGPTAQLHINAVTENKDGVYIYKASDDANSALVVKHDTGSDSRIIADFQNASGSVMKVLGGGNVGIGTASPASALDVIGTVTADGLDVTQGTSPSYFRHGTGTYLNITTGAVNGTVDLKFDASSGAYPAATFYTGNTERLRIDSSGNLLVGNTSNNTSQAGVYLNSNGRFFATHSSSSSIFNRLSTNGDILLFQKDTSTVGSIGANAGNLYIGDGDTNLLFADSPNVIIPAGTAGATRDAAIGLGNSSNRFSDLYLSGDIYVGDQIIHDGDTDTYMQFHNANEWRVVTGGTEMLEVNNDTVNLGANTVGNVETASKTGAVTPNLEVYNSFVWTLTGNITLNNPATELAGMSGVFVFIHSGAGRTVSLGTDWETAGGAGLTLSSTAGAVDIVPYYVQASGNILLGTPQLAFA